MNFHRLRERIPSINGWLLAAIFFALPTHAAPVYILSAFMLSLWLFQPELPRRMEAIFHAPVNYAFIAYYCVFLVSMLWTEDVEWGWRMVGRQIPFLLFPLYWSVARESNQQRRCISAFIIAIAMSVMLAHYNWLQIHIFTAWPEGIRADKAPHDTAPFVDHILYAPMLAFGAYFVGYRMLFERWQTIRQAAYIFLFIAIVINLVLMGGRAGLVGFFVLFITLVVQRLSRHPVRAVVLGLLAAAAILAVGYSASNHFRGRVDSAVSEAANSRVNINTSVGLRINFLINSSRLFAENPLKGVGVGDFSAEYKEVNDQFTPQAIATVNPHNQIMWVLSTTGVIGGVSLLALILATLAPKWRSTGESRHYLIAIWLGFAAICQFESYLWRSNTALLFALLMAVVMASSQKLSRSS